MFNFIPNSFTPNSDGLNDTFTVIASYIASYEIVIYNRWGEQIFKSNDIRSGWDGTYKGECSPPGVYYYHINTKSFKGKNKRMYGNLHLVR